MRTAVKVQQSLSSNLLSYYVGWHWRQSTIFPIRYLRNNCDCSNEESWSTIQSTDKYLLQKNQIRWRRHLAYQGTRNQKVEILEVSFTSGLLRGDRGGVIIDMSFGEFSSRCLCPVGTMWVENMWDSETRLLSHSRCCFMIVSNYSK